MREADSEPNRPRWFDEIKEEIHLSNTPMIPKSRRHTKIMCTIGNKTSTVVHLFKKV